MAAPPHLTDDDELRAAVFARVQQLRDRYGGRIPRGELMAGVTFHGERAPIWNPQQGIYKPRRFGASGAALTVQTSAESPYADVHDADAGHFIYKYRGTDAEHSDNIALRRAMWEQRPLLYLVAVDPGFYDAFFPVYVAADDPDRLQVTLVADYALVSTADPVRTSARREYVTRAVMQRLHQTQFRRIVLKAYRDRCAICRLKHLDLLDAAHILEDRHPLGEPVVSNGLGLCKIHHSAYDANIIGIDPDSRVHVREDVLAEHDGPMLQHGIQGVHGTLMTLPRAKTNQPNRDFLNERFNRFRTA